jgi:uncharacterized protein YuzE
MFEKKAAFLDREHVGGADVLNMGFGPTGPAVGADAGGEVVVRYAEKVREVVGLTIVGAGCRLKMEVPKGV